MDAPAPSNVMLPRCYPKSPLDAGSYCGHVDALSWLEQGNDTSINRLYHPKLVASTGVTETTLYELYRPILPYIQ